MEYSRRPTKSIPKENQLKILNKIYQTYLVSTTLNIHTVAPPSNFQKSQKLFCNSIRSFDPYFLWMYTAIPSSKEENNECSLVAAIVDCIIASCFGLCSVSLLWWMTLWMKVSKDSGAVHKMSFGSGHVELSYTIAHNPFPFILFTNAPVSIPPVMEDHVTVLMDCEDTWFSRHIGYSYFIAIVILELPLEMFSAVTITTRHHTTWILILI